MIYPSRLAVLAAAAGAPAALVLAAVRPDLWLAGLAWPATILLLCAVDSVAVTRSGGQVDIALPGFGYVGDETEAKVQARVTGPRPPARAYAAVEVDPLVQPEDDGRVELRLEDGRGASILPLHLRRRGYARVTRLWLRWRGPFGLVWRQQQRDADEGFPILPDVRPLHESGSRLFKRHALEGLIAQIDRGDGSDFDALVEFRQGMDRRAIDWKQSARHLKLHAKEFRSERNAQIVFAIDAGRQMSEPVAGLPRVDRAVTSALLAAWVALKVGDRVSLHAFDARPRIASGMVSGAASFPAVQALAARIDYSGEETNYTFALTTLAARLTRRSMIVLFTEFTDLTSAEFLVRASARLVQSHLLLVVVLRDEELETIAERAPEEPGDVAKAVTAASLLRDRRLVLTSLEHLGVHVVEAAHDQVGERLVQKYVELKRRDLL